MTSKTPLLAFTILVFLILGLSQSLAQNYIKKGLVQDTLQQAIAFTNFIATPLEPGTSIQFSIANQNGEYELKLKAETAYLLEISSLGFSPITDTIVLTDNIKKNYTLKVSTENLEEVLIKAKMAMIVTQDSTIYRADKFRTGEERKLGDLLKKLPGVEVDRDGNVSVNGKEVSTLLVDGKEFFGGDSKLAVKNIPADAIDEVEAIDKYDEVSFMKGLRESDRLAMNIKLKEDKKNFFFGENELGIGDKKHYMLNPRLFYYSPKTTFNLIGSFNDINHSPMGMEDVMRFRGGFSSYMDNPIQSQDIGLTQFSNQANVVSKKVNFGALNISHSLNKHLDIDAYSILAQQKNDRANTSQIEYLTNERLIENRSSEQFNKAFSNFNKVRMRYKPSSSKDLAYDLQINAINSKDNALILSETTENSNFIDTHSSPDAFEISQFLRYSTQPKFEHSSEIFAQHNIKRTKNSSAWSFDKAVFSNIIPFIEEDIYKINQDYQSNSHFGQVEFKHYWVVNPTNHIYPMTGLYYFNQNYRTEDYQLLQDGTINNFGPAGFNNDLDFSLLDPYFGFQYKTKIGEVIFRPGIVYHYYNWRTKQFEDSTYSQNKSILLPEFKLEYEYRANRKLKFDYNLKSTFADAKYYADRLSLISFNQLYQGNREIENSLYHNFSLNLQSFSIAKSFNINLNYRRATRTHKEQNILEGIDQISTAYLSHNPENQYTFLGFFRRRAKKIAVVLSLNGMYYDFINEVNNQDIKFDTYQLSYKFSIQSLFNDWPNVELGIQQAYAQSSSSNFKSKYTIFKPFIDFRYIFWNDFVFKTDYEYYLSDYKTSNNKESFQMANTSLYYRKSNSPWGFELRAENLFNTKYRHTHRVNQFMIYDQNTYIQGRIAQFILSYNL